MSDKVVHEWAENEIKFRLWSKDNGRHVYSEFYDEATGKWVLLENDPLEFARLAEELKEKDKRIEWLELSIRILLHLHDTNDYDNDNVINMAQTMLEEEK